MSNEIEPFVFHARFNLPELTGRKAHNLETLLTMIKEVPGSCIYHHTHRYLQQHERLSPEPPNDFAYWIASVLGEDELAENLASIDIVRFSSIRALRETIVSVIEEYIKRDRSCVLRFANPGREFHFIKSVSFISPTEYRATNLLEFKMALEKVGVNSIYFHMFEARLRLEKGNNDFSNWFETSLGDTGLADRITKLDPYTYALEDLRKTLLGMIEKRMAQHGEN